MRGRVPGRPAVGAVVVLLLLLVVAGCAGTGGGSGEDTARVASAEDGSADGGATESGADDAGGADGTGMSQKEREEKGLKFAQCMRENGVPMDDPDANGRVQIRINSDDVDRETVEQAQQACQKYAPFGKQGPQQDPKMAENMRNFAQCMRDNGVPDFPDPDGGRMMLDKSIADDPDFDAAQETCGEKFLPNRPGRTGGSR